MAISHHTQGEQTSPERSYQVRQRGLLPPLWALFGGRARPSFSSSIQEKVTTSFIGVLLTAASLFFLWFVNAHYRIEEWLFWTYLKCWLLALVFAGSSLMVGHSLLLRLLGRTLSWMEHLVFSFCLGAFAFFFVVLGFGLLGWLSPAGFVLTPLLLIALGGRATISTLLKLRRHRGSIRRIRFLHLGPWQLLSWGLGIVALLALYLPTLTPDNICYDSRWYHIPLAEHYVAAGGVERLNEGWFLGSYPHLASFYFTWALLWPGASFFERLELIAHLEFIFFLFTLMGIPILVKQLLPQRLRTMSRGSWAFLWLFSGIFAYDSSLHAGADHFVSVWVAPLFVVFLRSLGARDRTYPILLSIFAAAILNTKISALIAVAFPVLAYGAYTLFAGLRGRRPGTRSSALSRVFEALVLGLALTTPFWLKNWVYYGNPVYPKLTSLFGGVPLSPDYRAPLEQWFYPPQYHASSDLRGLGFSLAAQVQFSFTPFDWNQRPFPAPYFGSAYTLSLLALPFLGKQKRAWALVAAIQLGLFLWVQIHYFERYLQTILPWMAAVTAAISILVWHKNKWLRGPLAVFLVTQSLWGTSAYFKPHAMAGSALKSTIDLLSTGHSPLKAGRFKVPQSWSSVSQGTKRDAKFLVHEAHVHWGLERRSVSDWQGTQGGISYVRHRNLSGVDALFRTLGVTHLVWSGGVSQGYDTLGSDLLFFDYAISHGVARRVADGKQVATIPEEPLKSGPEDPLALLLTCGANYRPGIYRLSRLTHSDWDLNRSYPPPNEALDPNPSDELLGQLFDRVAYVVQDSSCQKLRIPRSLSARTQVLAKRQSHQLLKVIPAGPQIPARP